MRGRDLGHAPWLGKASATKCPWTSTATIAAPLPLHQQQSGAEASQEGLGTCWPKAWMGTCNTTGWAKGKGHHRRSTKHSLAKFGSAYDAHAWRHFGDAPKSPPHPLPATAAIAPVQNPPAPATRGSRSNAWPTANKSLPARAPGVSAWHRAVSTARQGPTWCCLCWSWRKDFAMQQAWKLPPPRQFQGWPAAARDGWSRGNTGST